jgi:hypothetical protein
MRRFQILMAAAAATLLLGGCFGRVDADSARREAQAFNTQAENCLLDVRDKGYSYEGSTSCQRLGDVSKRYTDTIGLNPESAMPDDIELVAEQALRMAWTAKALSLTEKAERGTVSLW